MERRARPRRPARPGRVAPAPRPCGPLAHIAALIEQGGQVTVGRLDPVPCAAIASDEHNCLAMLQRRPGETLHDLLARLDTAIARAWTDDDFTDEINPPTRPSRGE